MKEKKSKGLRKALLMAVAMVLVIAISVSATLAFLTDSTEQRDNVFTGKTSNISGEIIEPHFTPEHEYWYSPGTETRKDPMIQNDSEADKIFTAVKLTFYIRVEDSNNDNDYVKVPWSTFDKYVDIYSGTGTSKAAGFNADDSLSGSKPWVEFTGSDSYARYFAYKTPLDKHDSTENGGADTSAAIFDYVQISKYINIPETVSGTAVANNESDINTAGDWLNATVASGQTIQNQYRQEFNRCDVKIKIEGYGIDAGTATAITAGEVSDLGSLLG